MDSVRILKTEMSVTNIDDVTEDLIFKNKISVAICNANTLVRCYKDKELNNTINSFDIRCTDGFPVAKASKIIYKNNQMRVDGYKLFLETIERGLSNNVSHYFFGNSEEIVIKIKETSKSKKTFIYNNPIWNDVLNKNGFVYKNKYFDEWGNDIKVYSTENYIV